MLPRVNLTAADDELLFEVAVRLQYAETEQDVVSVLQQLAFCIVLDFPPAALLQRRTLLDLVLETMEHTSAAVRQSACKFVHSLVLRTKQAVAFANDSEKCPMLEGAHLPRAAAHAVTPSYTKF
jgi:hypothetical protein